MQFPFLKRRCRPPHKKNWEQGVQVGRTFSFADVGVKQCLNSPMEAFAATRLFSYDPEKHIGVLLQRPILVNS